MRWDTNYMMGYAIECYSYDMKGKATGGMLEQAQAGLPNAGLPNAGLPNVCTQTMLWNVHMQAMLLNARLPNACRQCYRMYARMHAGRATLPNVGLLNACRQCYRMYAHKQGYQMYAHRQGYQMGPGIPKTSWSLGDAGCTHMQGDVTPGHIHGGTRVDASTTLDAPIHMGCNQVSDLLRAHYSLTGMVLIRRQLLPGWSACHKSDEPQKFNSQLKEKRAMKIGGSAAAPTPVPVSKGWSKDSPVCCQSGILWRPPHDNPEPPPKGTLVAFKPPPKIVSLTDGFRVLIDPPERVPGNAPIQNAHTRLFLGGSTRRDEDRKMTAGGGIWYGNNHEANASLRLDEQQPQSTLSAEAVTAVVGLRQAPQDWPVELFSLKKALQVVMTDCLQTMEDRGWIGISDRAALRALAAQLKSRDAPTLFRGKQHNDSSQVTEGHAGAAQLVRDGCRRLDTTGVSLEVAPEMQLRGVKLSTLTQKTAYVDVGIKERKAEVMRKASDDNVKQVTLAIHTQLRAQCVALGGGFLLLNSEGNSPLSLTQLWRLTNC
ncbi:hypothetical protein FB451DRAFT_1172791 [Mycena latifolia]|nr:hypothetical protein FB451DRAFT_1172791 [Mycena latifolia]